MEDEKIISLYWARDEQAITETSEKYGPYCRAIAHNILFDPADEEECLNDTWLRAWNAIPPQRPRVLSVFLGKITKNLSYDMYRKKHREKRGGGEITLVLEELSECVSGNTDPEQKLIGDELNNIINSFLATLSDEYRHMFIIRYWYSESIRDMAKRFRKSENSISVTLSRIRGRLKTYLAERGYDI